MKFNAPFFVCRSGIAGRFCSPLAWKLGLTALLAVGLTLPGRADNLNDGNHFPADMTVTPSTTASGFKVEDTVLPDGMVRHTVRRAAAPQTDLNTSLALNQIGVSGNALRMSWNSDVLAMRRQATAAGRLLPLELRLGASVSPRFKFAGGVDYTLVGLGTGSGLSTRVDFDAIVSANFGGVSTLFPLTIDEIIRAPLSGGTNVYAGVGVGPMLGERTRFGGKILVGGHLSDRLSLEGTVLFAGYGDPLFNVQVRFPIL